VKPKAGGRFAERVVTGRDDAGREERIVVWIERRAGAVWAVGRVVNSQLRAPGDARTDDYVWEGYELDDCLDVANATLEDDCVVSEGDGSMAKITPFRREELLGPLEKYFFGR
jgi:hypothetical protein